MPAKVSSKTGTATPLKQMDLGASASKKSLKIKIQKKRVTDHNQYQNLLSNRSQLKLKSRNLGFSVQDRANTQLSTEQPSNKNQIFYQNLPEIQEAQKSYNPYSFLHQAKDLESYEKMKKRESLKFKGKSSEKEASFNKKTNLPNIRNSSL